MTDPQKKLEAMLDEYVASLRSSDIARRNGFASTGEYQKRIDQARLRIVQEWTVQSENAKHYKLRTERLEASGDRLAHELIYADHRDVMEAWWEARGGHHRCSVCNPDQPGERVPDRHPGEPVPCGCRASGAWECARVARLGVFVTCQCHCHRSPR